MVQVREKHGDMRAFIERAQAVKSVLARTGVPLIINARVDVALAVDADGLHLGQSDMPATFTGVYDYVRKSVLRCVILSSFAYSNDSYHGLLTQYRNLTGIGGEYQRNHLRACVKSEPLVQ